MPPPLLPTGPRGHERSTFFTRLCCCGLGSHALAAWGQSPVSSENREWGGDASRCHHPSAPPSSWQASGSSFSGWLHFLVSRDLSVWFRLKTQRGRACTQNRRNSGSLPAPSTPPGPPKNGMQNSNSGDAGDGVKAARTTEGSHVPRRRPRILTQAGARNPHDSVHAAMQVALSSPF